MSCVFTPPQILLVSDYFYAYLRREHHLTHGLYLKKKDGTEATLVLKWPSFTGLGDLTDCLTHHISALFFYCPFTLHFFSLVFSSLISICLSLLFSLFLSFAHLSVYLMLECWPPLGPKLFCTRLFDNGADWRYLSDTELYYLVPMRWVQSYLHFWFACVSKDLFSLLNSIEKVKSFGWTCSLKSWSAEGITWMWSDHKHWLQRAKTEDILSESDTKSRICSNIFWMLFLVKVFLSS